MTGLSEYTYFQVVISPGCLDVNMCHFTSAMFYHAATNHVFTNLSGMNCLVTCPVNWFNQFPHSTCHSPVKKANMPHQDPGFI